MRLSASRLDLAKSCLWWARPEIEEPQQTKSKHQELGVQTHLAIAGVLSGEQEFVSDEAVALCEAWKRHPISKLPWRPEIAFAWNPQTGESIELSSSGHRDYSRAPPSWIVGTVDAYCIDPQADDTVLVADWKTGLQGDLDAAKYNAQLLFLCLAAARATGRKKAIGAIAHITLDGVLVSEVSLDEGGLELLELEFGEIAERLADDPMPQLGAHCSGCAVRAQCPTTSQIVERVESEIIVKQKSLPVIDPNVAIQRDTAIAWYRALDALDDFVDTRRRELRDLLAQGEVSSGNARLKLEDQQIETIALNGPDGPIAREILDNHGLLAAVEVKESCSWEAIRALCRKKGISGAALAEAEQSLRNDLRQQGVLREKTIQRVVERSKRRGPNE